MHSLLAAYYAGRSWSDLHSTMVDELLDRQVFEEEAQAQLGEADLCAKVMERYVSHAPAWRVFSDADGPFVEREVDVALPNGTTLRCRIDLVKSDAEDRLWIVDHKTTEDFDKGMELRTDFDPQLSFYVWALRNMGLPIEGGIHNFIRMRVPAEPSINKDGSMSAVSVITDAETVQRVIAETGAKEPKGGLQAYLEKLPKDAFFRRFETVRSETELSSIVREIENKVRERQLARDNEMYTRTIITECQRCPFFRPCLAGLKGGDEQFILNESFRHKEDETDFVIDIL